MKLKKFNRKGFTIVELVIVIAIIAILAAVLIPTFVYLVDSANASADVQAVRIMNEQLAIDEVTNGKPENVNEALDVLKDAGISANNYTALTSGYVIIWDGEINRILLVEENGTVVYPEEYKEREASAQWYILETANSYNESLVDAAVLSANSASVARIGSVGYTTLSSAIAESNSEPVRLLADVTEDVKIVSGVEATIDLNGCSIVGSESHVITNEGTLTITGSGTVESTVSKTAAVYNGIDGTLILNGGTYTRSSSSDYYVLENKGKMTISNATVTSESTASSLIENGWYYGSENTENKNAVLIIDSGEFSGGLNTLKNDDCGEVIINGGTFTNETQHAVMNYGTMTINNGSFSGADSALYNDVSDSKIQAVYLTINDGTFTGKYALCSLNSTSNTTAQIILMINGGDYNGTVTDSQEGIAYIENATSVTVKNGTFKSELGSCAFNVKNTSSISIENGEFVSSKATAFYANSCGSINISNGTFKGKTYGVSISKTSSVEITGGTFEAKGNSTSYGIYVSSSTVDIKGGSFTAEGTNTSYGIYILSSATATINGGTFTAEGGKTTTAINVGSKSTGTINGGIFSGAITVSNSGGGTLSITGGTFTTDPNSYVAEGHTAIENDGKYIVT